MEAGLRSRRSRMDPGPVEEEGMRTIRTTLETGGVTFSRKVATSIDAEGSTRAAGTSRAPEAEAN